MKRFTLTIALLLVAAAARAETNPTGSTAPSDLVALNLCQAPAEALQAPPGRTALAARQQGFTAIETAPLSAEELNVVHGRYLLGGAPLQPFSQQSDVKLWDEGRAVARPQQSH